MDVSNNTNIAPNPFFFVKYDSTGCDSTLEYCLNPTSILETGNIPNEISIFPNPSNSNFYISVMKDVAKELSYRVLNLQGKIIRSGAIITEKTTELSLTDIDNGLYIIEIYEINGALLHREKLVKQD